MKPPGPAATGVANAALRAIRQAAQRNQADVAIKARTKLKPLYLSTGN